MTKKPKHRDLSKNVAYAIVTENNYEVSTFNKKLKKTIKKIFNGRNTRQYED